MHFLQGKMMKQIKRKKSLQASAPANILSQFETSLINKQVNIHFHNFNVLSKSSLKGIFEEGIGFLP